MQGMQRRYGKAMSKCGNGHTLRFGTTPCCQAKIHFARILQNEPIKEKDLQYIIKNYILRLDQIQRLKSLIGQPFNNILHDDYGVFNLRLGEKHERTTATHIPVLGGTYAGIQYILHQLEIEEGVIISIADFNAYTYPSEECLIKKKRYPKCICNNQIYQKTFKNKWV